MKPNDNRKRLVGRVVSNKMDKTVVVVVERLMRHAVYDKVLRLEKRYKAHDEENACPIGAIVRIVESHPISREKRWVIEEILEEPETVTEVVQ